MEPGEDKALMQKIRVYSEILSRRMLFTQLGTDSYDGTRDLYQALGYPKELKWQNYWSRYGRQDIAKAIIDRPVKASWKGEIEIIETIEKQDLTAFEKAWSELYERLKLKSIFIRADKLTGIGEYSVIFLGLNDTSKEGLANPVSKRTGLKLLYVKPLSQETASIATYVEDATNPRYGLPLLYDIRIQSGTTTQTVKVHYTRVVHLVEEVLDDEVHGTPRLQAVYNRLMDIEKLVGGDSEMFWRGARPGYTGEVDKDYQMTPEMYADLKTQIDEFENNLRRILINEGVKYNALEQQIADPLSHVDVQMQMISAVTGIPKRILTGSERGELSSAQDKLEWISYVTSRREEQNEPNILRPFIDKCIEIGVLPKPSSPYIVRWDKLFSLSDKEKVDIGHTRALAMKEYSVGGIEEYVTFEWFLTNFLHFDDVLVKEAVSLREQAIKEEEELTKDEEDILGQPGAGDSRKSATDPQGKAINPNPVSGVRRVSQIKN